MQKLEDQTGYTSLFEELEEVELPDVVHEPTYQRMQRFLRQSLGREDIVPERLTVRALVAELCKFNTSGTLCWRLAKGDSAGSKPHGAAVEQSVQAIGDAQRVFALCAAPVKARVVEVLEELQRQPAVISARSPPAALDWRTLSLEQWLTQLGYANLLAPLRALGAETVKDVLIAVDKGFLTTERLAGQGVGGMRAFSFIHEAQSVALGD